VPLIADKHFGRYILASYKQLRDKRCVNVIAERGKRKTVDGMID
jgi:hypothetical protein